MIDADGTVLVADASLPRLLTLRIRTATRLRRRRASDAAWRRSPGGDDRARRAANARTAAACRASSSGVADRAPRPTEDGARASRRSAPGASPPRRFALGRRFAAAGDVRQPALDGGRPGVPWHRVEVELNGDPPPGTSVVVETFTVATPRRPGRPVHGTRAERDSARQTRSPYHRRPIPDQLVQSPRGRFLWLRVTLVSQDGNGTPSVRAIRRLLSARELARSAADGLPPRPRSGSASSTASSRCSSTSSPASRTATNEFSRELNPDAAPREVIDWLAASSTWRSTRRGPSTGAARWWRRRCRSTACAAPSKGIERYVEIYTGIRPTIIEGLLERPTRPAFLGRPGSVLGCGLPILGCGPSPAVPPDDELVGALRASLHDATSTSTTSATPRSRSASSIASSR